MLDKSEKALLKSLGEIWNQFIELPDPHPSDYHEFAHHLHILKRHVLARAGRRALEHPEKDSP